MLLPQADRRALLRAPSEQQLTVINDSLRGQLSTLPLPSPASGFSFRFDPTGQAVRRYTGQRREDDQLR